MIIDIKICAVIIIYAASRTIWRVLDWKEKLAWPHLFITAHVTAQKLIEAGFVT